MRLRGSVQRWVGSVRRRGGCCAAVGDRLAGVASGRQAAVAIKSQDLKEWLTYIASDELEGRAVYQRRHRARGRATSRTTCARWGVKPAGDHGSYLQTVRVLGVKTTSRSTVTVKVDGETRTFADGDGITFPKNMGGKRRVTVDRVEFAGYGLDAPARRPHGLPRQGRQGRRGRLAGPSGPEELDQATYRRLLTGRNRYATEQLGAAASIGPGARQGPVGQEAAGDGGSWQAGAAPSRRAGTRRAAAGRRLHDRAAARHAGAAERQRQRRVLRVSLQPARRSGTTS